MFLDRSSLVGLDDSVLNSRGDRSHALRADVLSVSPRTVISKLDTALALALAAKLNRQVLDGDLLEQLRLVLRSENKDLGNGDGIKETLDQGKDGSKSKGSVDEVELAHSLGVVVLANVGGLTDVGVDLGGSRQRNSLEIHDGARGLHKVSLQTRAGRKSVASKRLVLPDQVLEHLFLSSDLVHFVDLDSTELLNVDWSAVLVGLVVILGVVLRDLLLLIVVEIVQNSVGAKLLAPFLALDKHFSRELDVELTGSQESEHGGQVETVLVAKGSQSSTQLLDGLFLLRGKVSRMASASIWGSLLRVGSSTKKELDEGWKRDGIGSIQEFLKC